nr:MAG TPA: hypothetical protein [Caudoviricetes sp.]
MSKTTVTYKDVAVGAQEDAAFTAVGKTPESVPALLAAGVSPGKVITLERDLWALDGTFDQYYEQSKIAFWSTEISGDDGAFTADPVITVNFDQQYSSMGISFVFDDAVGDYVSLLNIKWYQGGTLKADQDFAPNAASYFCSKRVESYDKLVITLKKTYPARRRAKINRIVFGVERTFGMTELRKASITNEMDENSVELPISTFAWTLDSAADVDYLFQLKQPVEVWNSNNLLGVYYINASSRVARRVYDIDCHDALGVLSESQFAGGAYLSGASAKSLLETLCAPFSVEYAEGVIDAILKGVLEPQPKRDAIRQVVFAWGVCLATDGGSTIRVFTLPKTAKAIPKASTFTGASVETTAVVTAVKLTAHTYAEDANGDVTINGQSYSDTESVYTVSNPNVTASDRQNIIEITGATMVSTDAAQAVAQRVYDYYQKRDTISAKIVYGGEKLGDALSVYTPWDTLVSGNLSKMEITLSNTVVYKAEVTGA